jgi:phosphatidylglycerophosphate synthase
VLLPCRSHARFTGTAERPAAKPGTAGAAPPPEQRPAIIICDPGTRHLRIAALSVLDRLLIAAHRAGFAPITVIRDGPLPPVERARAWRISYTVADSPPPVAVTTLILRTNVLVQAPDLRRLKDGPARLVDRDQEPLAAGLVPPGTVDPQAALRDLPAVVAIGVAGRVEDQQTARRVEKALWASLTSSSDGWVDRVFNRPVGRPLAKLFIHTPVTPNMISISATAVGVLAAAFFALGRPAWSIGAAILFQLSAVVDCVDGDVARSVFKETPLGKWLDLAGDQVVHVAVFLGIAWGLHRAGTEPGALWLGGVASAGALLSFLAVLRGMKVGGASDGPGRLQPLIDAATNRDFSVLVLILAVLGRLEWFLWLAAIGSHVFWVICVWLQGREQRALRTPF